METATSEWRTAGNRPLAAWRNTTLLTDNAGRYQITLAAQMKVWLGASKDGYVTQCAVPPVTLLGDTRVDVQLVSRANLSASTVHAPAAGFRSVSGVISEVTGSGQQPVAGADGMWLGEPLIRRRRSGLYTFQAKGPSQSGQTVTGIRLNRDDLSIQGP
jgi:hypothetical protein